MKAATFFAAAMAAGLLAPAIFVPPAASAQCPMCKEALTNDGEAGGAAVKNGEAVSGLAQGFFWSILLMLAVPFTLVAAIVVKIVWMANATPANGIEPSSAS